MNYRIDLKELAARESEQVEWKENVADPDDVVRTVVAFANDFSNLGGGYVVCGAAERKDEHGFQRVELVGLTNARLKEVEARVLSACRAQVEPPIVPLTEEIPCEDPSRRILVFLIPATGHAHSFRTAQDSGKYHVRIGRETREARNGLLRDLLVRKGAKEPWDRRFHPETTLDDVDLIAFRDLLQRVGAWDPSRSIDDYFEPRSSVSPFVPSFCVREPLTGVLRPRNFTLLLAGRNIQRFYPDIHTVFSIYPGQDRAEPYSERVMLDGTLVAQAHRLIELLNTEAYMMMDKSGSAEPNLVKYPRRALHEAVVNALVHRDYDAPHPVRVTAFSDRVEVFSPGGLPTAIEPEVFLAGRSMPCWRNQSLAWFLNKLQLAQAEGQGVATILRTMREEGCPEPLFHLTAESVSCILPAHPRYALMRDLRETERLFTLGRETEARAKVEQLLEADPFNARTINLFCEIELALEDHSRVLRFARGTRDRLSSFPTSVRISLAGVLSNVQGPDSAEAHALARDLLRTAIQSRMEEAEAKSLLISLLKVGEEQAALDLVTRLFAEHPSWETNPSLLQLRGNTYIQFAKRCSETAHRRMQAPRLKAMAWQECRRYLSLAEKDLRAALEQGPPSVVRDHAERDLEFVARLKHKAQKPGDRR